MICVKVQADNIMLKERKLNIAPAIKKQVRSPKRRLHCDKSGPEMGEEGGSKNSWMICFMVSW